MTGSGKTDSVWDLLHPALAPDTHRVADMGEGPDPLQQVMMPLIDRAVCSAPDWYGDRINVGMMCLGYEEGGRAVCNVSAHANVFTPLTALVTRQEVFCIYTILSGKRAQRGREGDRERDPWCCTRDRVILVDLALASMRTQRGGKWPVHLPGRASLAVRQSSRASTSTSPTMRHGSRRPSQRTAKLPGPRGSSWII